MAGSFVGMPVGLWTIILALGTVPGEIVAGPAGMLAMVSVLATALVLVVAIQRIEVPASPARIRAIALRERSRRTAFLKLRDPDAPGRSRPRAPGH